VRYENRQSPEGINVTKVNPFAQFLKLLTMAAIFIVLLVVALQVFGSALAKRIPFKYEVQVMDSLDINLSEVEGNLLFYRGLLEKMPNENALAMVMAHEIAHINHRDPISGLGGGVASMIALSMITGDSGIAGGLLTQAGTVTATQFTRSMETSADTAALGAVYGLYGHVNGAGSLFEIMGGVQSDNESVPDWLERFTATHPLSNDRVNAVAEMAQQNGWSTDGELTALPESFMEWLNTD